MFDGDHICWSEGLIVKLMFNVALMQPLSRVRAAKERP